MSEENYAPPVTDYKTKKELIGELNKLLKAMSYFKSEYKQQAALEKKIERINSLRISIFLNVAIAIAVRVLLQLPESPIHVGLFDGITLRQNIEISVIMVMGIGLILILLKLFVKNLLRKTYEKKRCRLNHFLMRIYKDFGPSPVGFKYARPATVEVIRQLLLDGRADTVKEALNIMISDDNYSQLLNYQKSISRSGKQTAFFTGIGAFFGWRNSHWAKRTASQHRKNNG